jgi:hypothetical protein
MNARPIIALFGGREAGLTDVRVPLTLYFPVNLFLFFSCSVWNLFEFVQNLKLHIKTTRLALPPRTSIRLLTNSPKGEKF